MGSGFVGVVPPNTVDSTLCDSAPPFSGERMRTIRNSLGVTYQIALNLGAVLRLQQGVTIEPGTVLKEDFGHSDTQRLQEQLDRIITLPMFAVQLMYGLLLPAVREQVSFSAFLGDATGVDSWTPEDLVVATMELSEEVLGFFQGRIPIAALARRTIRVSQVDAKKAIAEIEALTDESIREMMQSNWEDPTVGGTKSTDLQASLDSETLTASPIDNSTIAQLEPSSEPPLVQPQSAPSLDNSKSLLIGS